MVASLVVSPPPSSPSHTAVPLELPPDIYYDPRTVEGPSRYAKAVLTNIGGGPVLSRCSDGVRCAVAGKDFLRVLRVNPPPLGDNPRPEVSRMSSSRRYAVKKLLNEGPGGATIQEEVAVRMSFNTLSTDVGWGHGAFSNKIVVASMSGEIYLADHGKSSVKLERTIKEHTRSVNGLAFSPYLPNYFATCSQDGYVKLWDIRSPDESYISIDYKMSTRAVTFCPIPSSPFHAVVALESGAFYKWDYRQGSLGLLDRIWDMSLKLQDQKPTHVLHTAEKVKRVSWRPGHDCEVAIVPTTPGLSVRPNVDGESTSDADRIEIWDVRRPWVPKYVLEGGEGAVIGMTWAGPDTLWATYSNGTFVQHDLRHCYRPLDGIPRSALAWEPCGSVTYANETVALWDNPYDDVNPKLKPELTIRGWKDKSPADPDYFPLNQTVGTVTIPVFDLQGFVELARGYVLRPDSDADQDPPSSEALQQVCATNAEVAHRVGYYRAAQTWLMLKGLLKPLAIPPIPPPAPLAAPASAVTATPPPASPAFYSASAPPYASAAAPSLTPLSLTRPSYKPTDRRTVSTGVIQLHPVLPPTPPSARFPKSSDNSPASEHRKRPSGGPLSATAYTKPSMSRRSSVATKVSRSSTGRRRSSESKERRSGSRGHSRSQSIDSVSRSRASSLAMSKHVGDGALDSDSDDGDLGIDQLTALTRNGALGHASKSSMSSNTLEVPDEAEELALHIPSALRSGTVLRPPSGDYSHLLYAEDHSDDAGALGDDNYTSSSSDTGRDSPLIAPPSSPVVTHLLSLERPKITKQDSRSSIKTAIPSQHYHHSREGSRGSRGDVGYTSGAAASSYVSSGGDTAGKAYPLSDAYLAIGSSTDGEFGGSTRKPSPVVSSSEQPPQSYRHRRMGSGGVSLRPAEDTILEVPSPRMRQQHLFAGSHSASPHPSTEATPLVRDSTSLVAMERVESYGTNRSEMGVGGSERGEDVRGRTLVKGVRNQSEMNPAYVVEQEVEMRKVGWKAVRDAFEFYMDKGDVQMCATLATVAKGELWGGVEEEQRLDQLSTSYVEMLTRLRLHTSAAYVRKHGSSLDLKQTTNLDTIMYTSCAKCNKPLLQTFTQQPPITPLPPTPSTLFKASISPSRLSNPSSLLQPTTTTRARQGSLEQRRAKAPSSAGLQAYPPSAFRAANHLVEGGYGFCSTCKSAAARCSICRLPVKGLHFFCPVCTHGGHHECYRQYYLRRPMLPTTPAANGTPGTDGWGLAVLTKPPEKEKQVPQVEGEYYARGDRRDSDPLDPKSIVAAGLNSVASTMGLAIGVGKEKEKVEKEKEKEPVRERLGGPREGASAGVGKKVVGHPCAAGCGHFCWIMNDVVNAS
ncbi:hypothetical protein FRB99_001741 [Tulasnella sp. 403]|nr:hypothetical protein FRB99_001741 [Tulasnella sp. 403]